MSLLQECQFIVLCKLKNKYNLDRNPWYYIWGTNIPYYYDVRWNYLNFPIFLLFVTILIKMVVIVRITQ